MIAAFILALRLENLQIKGVACLRFSWETITNIGGDLATLFRVIPRGRLLVVCLVLWLVCFRLGMAKVFVSGISVI